MSGIRARSLASIAAFLAVAFWMVAPGSLLAEDAQLRQRAIEMLERGTAASTPPMRPPSEHLVDFEVLNAANGEPQQGHQKVISAAPRLIRAEDDFGKFHLINIWNGDALFLAGENGDVIPTAFEQATRYLPIRIVRFDHEDTIRSIDAAVVRGRAAQCIEFATSYAEKVENNEICLDNELGTIVRLRIGADMEENSEFVRFAGAYFPTNIYKYRNGTPTYHVHQSFTVIEGTPSAELFAPPAGAEIRRKCAQMRRAFGRSMPQPPAGNGRENSDISIKGMIGPDGQVHSAGITVSDRPDLNDEALRIISTWRFDPLLCDGKAGWDQMEFVLHFQGR
jgi:hypothetical protein